MSGRILAAGAGNALKGDDAFGVAVLGALASDPRRPAGIATLEIGIGGIHLVQELMRGYDALILFDAVDRFDPNMGVKFKSIDVLSEPDIREGIKSFSNWPTIPQLYVNSEFIGGADIIREMYETGELETMFTDNGIAVAQA